MIVLAARTEKRLVTRSGVLRRRRRCSAPTARPTRPTLDSAHADITELRRRLTEGPSRQVAASGPFGVHDHRAAPCDHANVPSAARRPSTRALIVTHLLCAAVMAGPELRMRRRGAGIITFELAGNVSRRDDHQCLGNAGLLGSESVAAARLSVSRKLRPGAGAGLRHHRRASDGVWKTCAWPASGASGQRLPC